MSFGITKTIPQKEVRKMVDLYALAASKELLILRRKSSSHISISISHYFRTFTARLRLKMFKEMLDLVEHNRDCLDFHTRKTDRLPDYYANHYRYQMGKYYELLPLSESQPLHVPSDEVESLIVS